ncbi:MAG: protein kinase [Nannocystaceae bacterium]|nr:protein kinase [Nannocystaceae bacterium]
MKLPCKYGPYLLLERVSVGGMAEVYKAKEYGVDGFERTVAIKCILPHVAEDDEFIAMFKDEAKIAVQLAHGNIAQIYNLGNENESFYIALEYIPGRDLRAIFQKGQQAGKPMPVPQVCYVIMKICEGLDYAHNKKDKYQRPLSIIHRDVSPPNILVSYEGEVKLIDFGVAKAAGRASRTQAGILKGKFGYMSPEQVRGMPLDRRSDVFSVGVVLFETLTGTRLFQAETDFATLEKVRAVDVPRPTSLNPDIPKPLENILYKALAREPETRYQSSIELHDELQAFMFAQGMFYSRKDLAGWMRVQYAREIELEKEKDKAQASLRPEMFEIPTGDPAGSGTPGPRRQRKTMMMPGGSTPPPPPPSGGRRPPPPPPHGARPRTGGAAAAKPPRAPSPPTAAHQSVPIGPPLPNKKVKRKTMAQGPNRASLPPPPGARRKDEALTIPIDGGMQRPSAAPASQPRPKPSATSSYAAVETSDVDFDWDDDELETRLFEDEAELSAALGGANRVSTPGENRGEPVIGGAIAAVPLAPEEDLAQPRPSVTVVPPSAAAPALTMPAPMSAPIQPLVPPQVTVPAPMVMPQAAASMPAAPAMHPGMAPRGPEIVPATVDYDERPANKGNTGAIIGILVAVIVLLVAAFGAYLVLNKDDLTEVASSSASGGTAQAPAKTADGTPLAAAGGGVTLAVTPPDAKVFVDNKPQEGESPFIVQGVGVGKHKLLIKKDGFMPLEKEFVLSQSSLMMQFALQHRDVTLVLETDPKGAAVNLLTDGKATAMGAGGSEYKLTRVPGVKYEVEAVLAGFKGRRQDLSFGGSDTEKVSITLSRDGSIADAGRPVAPAPRPATTPSAPAAAKPKPPRKTKPRPSRPASKPAPKKSLAKTSLLRIGTLSGVAPAKVFVDGAPKGSTPLSKVMVTPGRHKVVFQWPNGKRVTKFVEVADGGSAIVRGG